jgi:putative chitinase
MKLIIESWRKYIKEEITRDGDYVVQDGDTLGHIASKLKVPLEDLKKANPQIEDPHSIQIGQQIYIPKLPAAKISTTGPAIKPTSMPAQSAEKRSEEVPLLVRQLQILSRGHLSAKAAIALAPYMQIAMSEADIDTPARRAAFLAQIAHESGGFKYKEEIASGRDYEGRKDLGNIKPGDGKRYKGRGYIQLTGRYNYRHAGKDLGLDLEGNPALASSPENAARVAAWFWKTKKLNVFADAGQFGKITQRINPGASRKSKLSRKDLHALAQIAR